MSVDDTNSPPSSKNAIDNGITVWNIQNVAVVGVVVELEEHPVAATEVGHLHQALLPLLGSSPRATSTAHAARHRLRGA